MTNTVLNATKTVDTLRESQMTELAYSLNAIEPGAGGQDYLMTGSAGMFEVFSGFEWLALACLLCAAAAVAIFCGMGRMRPLWRMLRKALPQQGVPSKAN